MDFYRHNAGVTGLSITFSLPPGQYLYTEPGVQVTVFGAPTQVDVAFVWGAIDGHGEVITGVTLTFQAGAVGKRFSLLVAV